jgi:hypothetical protein
MLAVFSILVAVASSAALAQHPPLNLTNLGVGDNAFPYLRLWGGVDQTRAHFYGSTNTGLTYNGFFYTQTTTNAQGGQSAFNGAARSDNGMLAYGGYFYGEADASATSGVWGLNLVGATYSANSVAHGVEINGGNNAPGNPVVDGLFIVNSGTAKTTAALVTATSLAQPLGRADYGIMLAGPNVIYGGGTTPTLPASLTGVFIDNITSGEAIRIQADHRVALNNAGTTYFRYNSATDTVQLVKNNAVVAQW